MKRTLSILMFATIAACTKDPIDTGQTTETTCNPDSQTFTEWDGDQFSITTEGCGRLELVPRLLGEGEWHIEFVYQDTGSWQPQLSTSAGGRFEGLVLEGIWELEGEADPTWWRQGYQSWSWSGVTVPGTANIDDDSVIEVGGDGDGRTVNFENDATSWWVGLLGRPEGGSVLLGAQGATRTRFFVGVDEDRLQAVWGHRGESIEVAPTETLTLDPLWAAMGPDPNQLHRDYADATTDRIPARELTELAPTGWATWYQYYSAVNEDDVRSNLEALIGLQADPNYAPVEVFQIDDGWQERWGDWWAGDDFPSGMAVLAEDIIDAGMTPGIWLAPFYMSTDSETYTEHLDWWVLDEAGDPILFSNLATGNYVILDVTHPEAAAWLVSVIEDVVAMGYDYLKLDFLYAGAMEGQRSTDVTGIEAYHIGMELLREAAGEAWILACGAPLLPSLGYAESFRTASDIAFESSTEPQVDFYRWQARSTAARSWTQGRWWWMDPDQVLVRDPLTDTEVSGAIASALVAGGTWMLGDDLEALDPARLALSLRPDILALRGQEVRPIDPLTYTSGIDPGPVIEIALDDDRVPHRWELADGTVVLLNLGTETVSVNGPGGTELLSLEEQSPGERTLTPGAGEIWISSP